MRRKASVSWGKVRRWLLRLLRHASFTCTVRNIFMTRNPAFFVQSLAWSAARVCWLLLAGQGRWFFLFLVDVFVRFSVLFFFFFLLFCSFVVVFVVFGSACFFLSSFFFFLCPFFLPLSFPFFLVFVFCFLLPLLRCSPCCWSSRFDLAWLGLNIIGACQFLFVIFSFSIWFLTGCWSIKSSVHS